ncbi:MAG: hypothetical protein ACLR56_07730 [Oscillospiraceae bacterium]
MRGVGRMGGFVADTAAADSDISVVAGLTKSITVKIFYFSSFGDINVKADMILIFPPLNAGAYA